MSNAKAGAAYKARSKKWLLTRGLQVADMEIVRTVFKPDGVVFTKRDQFGADLLYLDLACAAVVFVQVKGGLLPLATARAQAREAFGQFTFPRSARLELHVWRPRARAPMVEVLS